MKKIHLLLFAFFGLIQMNAQMANPVKWSSRTEKISANEFNLVFEGIIDDEWHVYSQFTPDGGSLPMEIVFKDAKGNTGPIVFTRLK